MICIPIFDWLKGLAPGIITGAGVTIGTFLANKAILTHMEELIVKIKKEIKNKKK